MNFNICFEGEPYSSFLYDISITPFGVICIYVVD